jgi:hypothetical protein
MTAYRDIVAKPTAAERRIAAGWDVDQRCECDDPPRPVMIAGDGFVCGPLMCTRCKKAART